MTMTMQEIVVGCCNYCQCTVQI